MPIPLTGAAWLVRLVLQYVITSRLVRWLNRRFNLLAWMVATVAPWLHPFSRAERAALTHEFDTPYGRTRNLPGPLEGREKVAAFVVGVGPQGADGVSIAEQELDGQPAIVLLRDEQPFTVIMLAVAEGLIRSVFIQADVARLHRLESLS